MPIDLINGVKLFWELNGSKGHPLVLVHGSWGDHHNWDLVAFELAKTFRVLTYDRRGHSQSERPPGQGHVEEDVDDLIGLIEHLNLTPAYITGNSFGAIITLRTAAKRPDLFRKMIIHEPPLMGLIKDNPNTKEAFEMLNSRVKAVMDLIAAGQMEKATETFMETLGMGPGTWAKLPEMAQKTFIYNAPTWYDEVLDTNSLVMDLDTLSVFKKPALLSTGSISPIFFPTIMDIIMKAIPQHKRIIIEGAGHVPHLSHPDKYIEIVTAFCKS